MIELDPREVRLTSEQIGFGGRYKVYKAAMDGVPVAAKAVIDIEREDTRRTDYDLQQEHLALEKLDHPAIPRTRGVWRDPTTGILHHVMELRTGRTLEQVVQARVEKNPGRPATYLNEAEGVTVEILGQVMGAVAHAHERGVLHNDLTPRNVHVSLDDDDQLVVSLVDFEASGNSDRGTLFYTAPERMDGKPPSPQSDVYSAAVMVFFVLTGLLPWLETTPHDALRERERRPLNDLKDDDSRKAWRQITTMPDYVGKALLHATAFNPDDRPNSMRAFMRELRIPIAEPPARKHTGLTWTAAILALLTVGVVLPPVHRALTRGVLTALPSDTCREEFERVSGEVCDQHADATRKAECRSRLEVVGSGLSAANCSDQLNELKQLRLRRGAPQTGGH